MRLETPVVYFHPPRSAKMPLHVNVEVAFQAGWLSEYYPQAKVDAPGIKSSSFGPLTAATRGTLAWNDLAVGTDATGPQKQPRRCGSPRGRWTRRTSRRRTAKASDTLFYRGVGHVDSPLRVSRVSQDAADDSLMITANFPIVDDGKDSHFIVPAMWLVDIRDDKSLAFRKIDAVRVANDGRPRTIAMTPAKLEFDSSSVSADELSKLSSSIHAALIEDGLNADEADALLTRGRRRISKVPGCGCFTCCLTNGPTRCCR